MGLLKYALIAAGVFLLLLGLLYLLASGLGPRYAAIGIGLILTAIVLLFLSYRLEKAKVSRPRLVTQNIMVEGSGDTSVERFRCRTCGNPLSESEMKMIDGAVVFSCSSCGNVYQLEEEPKW